MIVEVEAYDHEDPAAHGFGNRRTARNASMFLAGGHVYVYRSYGIHWCLNIVCGPEGVAERSADPGARADAPVSTRCASAAASTDPRLLCSGPGRLCQALGVTREHDGLRARPAAVPAAPARRTGAEIVTGPRIGITKAAERPWRYGLAGSRFVSRPFRER